LLAEMKVEPLVVRLAGL
jgi:hypothetical protein